MVKLPKKPQSRISKTGKGTKKRSLETSFMPDVELKTYQQKLVAKEKSPDKDFSYLEPEHRKQSPGTTLQFSITNGSGHILNRPQTHSAQDDGKRKRKPTRRYIEELTSSDTKEGQGKVNFLAAKEEKSLPTIRNKHHFYNEDENATREVTDIKFRTGSRSRGRPKKSGTLFLVRWAAIISIPYPSFHLFTRISLVFYVSQIVCLCSKPEKRVGNAVDQIAHIVYEKGIIDQIIAPFSCSLPITGLLRQ
jgi:hypothetical protein